MINIQDIAREAGVAKSTVSRYLNNGSVSPKTAKKIEEVIKKYNYRPSAFAQSLKAKTSNMIGAIVPRLDSSAASLTLAGMDEVLSSTGYQLLISNTNQNPQREIQQIYNFAKEKVAGIMLLAVQITEEHLQAIESIDTPVLIIGQTDPRLYCVVHDDYNGGKALAESMLKMGHRKITYIGVSEEDKAVGVARKQGVLDGLTSQLDVEIHTEETSFQVEDAFSLGLKLLKNPDATLYIAATDNIAIGILKAAHTLGKKVPEDISIAGFGGYRIGDYVSPSLTTVQFKYKEAGTTATKLLLMRLQNQKIPQQTVLGFDILYRDSIFDYSTALNW